MMSFKKMLSHPFDGCDNFITLLELNEFLEMSSF